MAMAARTRVNAATQHNILEYGIDDVRLCALHLVI